LHRQSCNAADAAQSATDVDCVDSRADALMQSRGRLE
jgi:hypothetical protein